MFNGPWFSRKKRRSFSDRNQRHSALDSLGRGQLTLEGLERRDLLSGQNMAAPTNLVATVDSQSEINLTWDLNDTTDTNIVIQRETGNSGTFQTLITLPGGENTYTDTSCWASTSYTYQVMVKDSAGNYSPYSSTAGGTTQAIASGALSVMTNLQVTANSPTTDTISFTDPNSSASSDLHFVERSSDGVSYQVVGSIETATTFNDSALTPGATYYYRVRSSSWSYPTSDYSATVSITMPSRPANTPIEPSGLNAVDLSSSSVQVTWTNNDPSNPAFEVDRAIYDPNHPMTWTVVTTTGPGATSFTDTGLSAESAYVYRVRAVNANGDSDYAAPALDYMHSIFGEAVGVVTASQGTGSPKIYNIGPGQTYADIPDLDWTKVGPGDTVNIYYKPGGYHDLFMISTRGTAGAPITINGIADPTTGALPYISGSNAVLAPQFVNHYAPVDGSGVVVIGDRPEFNIGYKPGYITVQNLQFQDAYQGDSGGNTFTDYDGSTKTYGAVGAGIYIERGDSITIQGCVITNNGEGVFAAGQSGFDRLMTNITLSGNAIYGNGNIGSYHEHNTYIEAIDTVYQYNYYGPLRSRSGGAGLKDRSVGTVIRYNYILGGAHQLQLPEAQNEGDLAVTLPEYHKAYVYGNILIAPDGDASSIVYFGGDQGMTEYYRKGVLYLYNNTLVSESNQSDVYKINAVILASTGETLDARNNIIASMPATPGQNASDLGLLDTYNNAYFGTNFVTHYNLTTTNAYAFYGHAAGVSNLVTASLAQIDFADAYNGNFMLAADSLAIDKSGRLPGSTATYLVNQQYIAPHSGGPRPVVGTALDLGAFEYGTLPPQVTNDAYTLTGPTTSIDAAHGVLANDSDPYDLPLTVTVQTAPAHGTLTLNPDGSFTYTIGVGFTGSDSFTYTASDGLNTSPPATVTLRIVPPLAVNETYVISSSSSSSSVDAAHGVLAGDSNPSGGTLTAVLQTGPQHGTLTLQPDGSFTYTPGNGFSGVDTFTYVAMSNGQASNAATVTLLSQPAAVIRKLYQEVLLRDPDLGGLAYWTGLVDKGVYYSQIAQAILESDERLSRLIGQFYQQYLLRAADEAGLTYWEGVWRNDGGPQNVEAGIVGSPEFYSSSGATSQGWLTALYQRLLGRAPDPQGLAYWTNKLDSGQLTRGQIVLGFVRSPESFSNAVSTWFNEYLGRSVDTQTLHELVAVMQKGASDRAIELMIIGSPEYASSPSLPTSGGMNRIT